jgi:hypothetical protein
MRYCIISVRCDESPPARSPELTRQLYLKLGYPASQTETIVEVLSYTRRRGNFQSLIQEVTVATPRFSAQR